MIRNRHHTLALHLLGLGVAVSLLGDATLYAVLPNPTISAQMGVSMSMVGVLLSANRAVRPFLNAPAGILYDHFRRRSLLITGMGLGALASILYALVEGFWPLFMARVLWGFAFTLLGIGASAVILDISTDENRARLTGIYQTWFALGVGFSSFVGALLTDWVGFRTGQMICAGLIALIVVLWARLLPEVQRKNPHKNAADGLKIKMNSKPLLAGAMALFAGRFVGWGVLAATTILWLSQILGERLQIGDWALPIATMTGVYIAFHSLGSMLSASITGMISDRIGKRWPVLAVTFSMGSVGLWLMGVKIPLVAIMGSFLMVFASSSAETLVPAIIGDRMPPQTYGRALGISNAIADIGSTLGPVFALFVIDTKVFTLQQTYHVSSMFLLVVVILSVMQMYKEKQKNTQIIAEVAPHISPGTDGIQGG